MATHDDLTFPNCCACCPHLQPFDASCSHDVRQSLVQELTPERPCPVYTREKTTAMRQLLDEK